MNNALLENRIDETDKKPWLRGRQDEIITIIQALESVEASSPWKTLKNLVFEGVTETLERRLNNEAKEDTPNTLEMARINGQLVWARKYSDLEELVKVFKTELEGVKNQLKD